MLALPTTMSMTMMGKSENFSPQEAASFFGQIFPCVKVYFNKGEIKFCFCPATAQTGVEKLGTR